MYLQYNNKNGVSNAERNLNIVDKLFVEMTSGFAFCRHSGHEAPPVERTEEWLA